MTQYRLWYVWLLIFLGFIILGGIVGYIFMYFLNPYSELSLPPRVQDHEGSGAPVIRSRPEKPTLDLEQGSTLKNPFIVPPAYQRNSSHRTISHRRRAFLEYRGIIETDNYTMGLVTVSSTGESLVVYEGEDLVELGTVIDKITAKTLTYSKNGIETVISLGGIEH